MCKPVLYRYDSSDDAYNLDYVFRPRMSPDYLAGCLRKCFPDLCQAFEYRKNEYAVVVRCEPLPSGNNATCNQLDRPPPPTQTMVPANMRRYDTSTHDIPTAPYTQPHGHTLQQHAPSRYRPIAPHQPVVPGDPQTFPILPGQLDRHLAQARQRLTHSMPPQAEPASGPPPSPDPGRILVLNPPPQMIPTANAFYASTLGMPSIPEYLRFLMRYLDEMAPNKRGKALIDSELLERIKFILALQHKGFSGSGETSSDSESAPPVSYGTGGSWDTQAFRRWVRNTFDWRPATRSELERAIDFGLLSPPESSLSGPGVPGQTPSMNLACSRNLVFHQDRPVALRSRIYKILARAHWITNHAGRDKTWAMVREVCSYIPKCLVYDFVAACPTCRVARSKQYGIYTGKTRGISAADVEKLLKFREKLQHESQGEGDKDDSNFKGGLPPILPLSLNDTTPEGWIPRIGPNGPLHPYPTPMATHPLWHHRNEINAQILANTTSDIPLGPVRLSPLQIALPQPISVPRRVAGHPQQPNPQGQDLWEPQHRTPPFERRYPSWTGISKVIEIAARSGRDEDVDMLEDSPSLMKRYGPSGPVETVGSIRGGVGHGAMVNMFPRAVAW
jgi:hypothetical protein